MNAPALSITPVYQAGITRLVLTHFRNYPALDFLVAPMPVVLTGENGAGKTSILEALSLLSPGKGLHRTKLSAITHISASNLKSPSPYHWTVFADALSETGDLFTLGTGLDLSSTGAERRHVKINGVLQKKQGSLTNLLSVVWVTPQMGTIFIDSGSNRRKFIDQMAFAIDPTHADRLHHYEYHLRQRSHLLKEGSTDDRWLSILEKKCAEDAVALTSTRNHLIQLLNKAQPPHKNSLFPHFKANITGVVEDLLNENNALDSEEKLIQLYHDARRQDTLSSGSQIGPHRSDFSVINLAKNLPAEVCSTGEQKMILLALIIAFAKVHLQQHYRLTLLLLDDVIAHLDDHHRFILFQELCAPEMAHNSLQTWMTGTDPHEFNELRPYAQFFSVTNATLSNG